MKKSLFLTLFLTLIYSQIFSQVNVTQSATWSASEFLNPSKIPSNSSWNPSSGELTITGDVTIKRSGVSKVILNITSIKVKMGQGSKIILDEGESLIISNSTIESGTYFWGIECKGLSNVPQFNLNVATAIPNQLEAYDANTQYEARQTNLLMEGSFMNNSEFGIVSKSGAIIRVKNCLFINNLTSVKFEPYIHPNNGTTDLSYRNASYIENSEFRFIRAIPFNYSIFYTSYINLKSLVFEGVHGIHIAGVKIFTNGGSNHQCGNLGIGIYSRNSSIVLRKSGDLILDPNTDCYSYGGSSSVQTSFSTLTFPVYLDDNNSTKAQETNIICQEINIQLSQNGIYANNVDKLLIEKSNIDNTNFASVISTSTACLDIDLIKLNNVSEFVINQNYLKIDYSNISSPVDKALSISNSGAAGNIVFGNEFFAPMPELYFYVNKAISILGLNSGLDIFCNSFAGFYHGIVVESGATVKNVWKHPITGESIENNFPGLPLEPDILNNTGSIIQYHVDQNTFFYYSPVPDWDIIITNESNCVPYNCNEWPVLSYQPVTSNQVKIYPNPLKSNGIINLDILENESINSFKIFNSLGIEVGQGLIENKNIKLQRFNLNNGNYYLIIYSNENIIKTEKLLIQD